MTKHTLPLLCGLSVILGIAFWIPWGSVQSAATPYVPLEGKTFSMLTETPTIVVTTSAYVVLPSTPAAIAPTATGHRVRAVKPRGKKSLERESLKNPVATVPESPTPPPQPEAVETFDSISERYENDASDYSMNHPAQVGGVTLRLLGLERLAAAYVLKFEVTNDGGSDFYVKDLIVQAAARNLINKPYFRILVEAQRTRVGYVVFEKPLSGAAVQIKLKEEGGKGRALEARIPYPF